MYFFIESNKIVSGMGLHIYERKENVDQRAYYTFNIAIWHILYW